MHVPWWLTALAAGALAAAVVLPLTDTLPGLPDVPGFLAPLAAAVVAAVVAAVLARRLEEERRARALVVAELDAVRSASSEAILRLDRDGTILAWNDSAQALLDRSGADAVGQPASALLPVVPELVETAAREGAATTEATFTSDDGHEVTMSLTVLPVRDASGAAVGSVLTALDVGEATRAREDLREADWKRRMLAERLPLVTYAHAVGARRSVVEVSPQIERLLGYSAEEWTADPDLFSRLLHPDDRDRVLGEVAAAAGNAGRFRSEYRMIARDGRTVWLRDEATTVRDSHGRLAYVQGYLLDISERKRAAQEHDRLLAAASAAAAESAGRERKLDLLAAAGDVLASSLDYETTLRRVAELAVRDLADWCMVDVRDENETLRRLAVVHAEPLPGGRPARTPGRDPEPVVVQVAERGRAELTRSNGTAAGTGRQTHRFGDVEAESWISVPLRARGRPLGAVTLLSAGSGRSYGSEELAVAQDLGRRASLAVDNARLYREVEERADAAQVLTYVGDGVFLLDRGGAIRLWNPAAEAITGFTAAAVVGRLARDALPGWQALADRIPVATSPEPNHAETVPVETERGERWLSISGVQFFGGTVYAFRDVTDERRLDELKAEFVATASHELRTPLAAVYGAAQTLRRHDFALDESGRERFVSLIVDESERLSRIVNEILLANQLDADRLDVETEPFDPADLVDRVVESIRTHTHAGISLEVVAPPVVPLVAADRDRARQVLVNLIENAIKYSPDGGRIEVALEPGDGVVRFSVTDEGLGIPADHQARIFEKFYRLDPDMTRGVSGTGLGLYICSELLTRMGGRIWVESTAGEGSTFFFELPIAEPELVRPLGPATVDAEASPATD